MIDNTKHQDDSQKTPLMSSRDEISEYESAVAFLKEFHARNVALHPCTTLFKIDEEEMETVIELETSSAFSCPNMSAIHPLHEGNQCQIKRCASFPPQTFDIEKNDNELQLWSLSSLDTEEIIDIPKESDNRLKGDGRNYDYPSETSESQSWGFYTQPSHNYDKDLINTWSAFSPACV